MIQKTRPVSVPLLDVKRDNEPLREEFISAITRVLDSGYFIGGPDCQLLEKTLASYCQTKFAVGCASGSDALVLALLALGIGEGDEVIVPSFTFFATASSVARVGARPVFCDIEPETFNLDVDQVESLVTSRTKAVIPVHLFGQCCEMGSLMEVANRRGLKVIEDCAQSIGAGYRGQQCGGIGEVGCFSFYPTKNLGGFGDGGIMTTNDAELADRIRLWANHGMRPRYHHQVIGINSRLDSFQAALLAIKLQSLPAWTAARQANAARYHELFAAEGLGDLIAVPQSSPECDHVWNQFTIRVPGGRRDEIRQQLAEHKIGSEVYYPIPLHRQVCFSYLGYEVGSLPETERACGEVLSLPIFPGLLASEQEMVVETLAGLLRSGQSVRRAA
jgi:dTDP-4-amino-4,6-dideoxygalactose transaminase